MSEIASSAFESVLFVIFLTIFLKPKRERKIIYFGVPVCVGLLFLNIVVSDHFSMFSVYTILIDLVIAVFFWRVCLQGTFLKFFTGFSLYYFGLYFSSYISIFSVSFLAEDLSAVINAGDSANRILCIVLAKSLLIIYAVIILFNRSKFSYGKNHITILSYLILPVISLSVFTVLSVLLTQLYLKEPQLGFKILIAILGVLFMLALNIYLAINAARRQEKEREIEKLHKMLEIQRESIERFVRQEKEQHKVKHDLNHRLYSVRYLLAQNKTTESIEIFQQMIGEVYGNSRDLTVEQNIVDTVISNIEVKYASKNVLVQKEILYFDDSKMDLADLCVLLGNLADNAIEAAGESAEKIVTIVVREEKNCLNIKFSNTFSEKYSDVHNFSTRKGEAWKHGFGLHSIREIVDKYHGQLWIDIGKVFLQISIVIFG